MLSASFCNLWSRNLPIEVDREKIYTVDGARIKCWKYGDHGQQTFLEVVQDSCNPGPVELATTSFGQGVTALQLAV